MHIEEAVYKIRAFNRFYMPFLNLLGNHYLGSEYSVPETRVFFEIHENDGCNAAFIAEQMNIDKSYLSRILKNHEKNGYIFREASEMDGRSLCLHLTKKGRKRAEELIELSNAEIRSVIDPLTKNERGQLIDALETVTVLLNKTQGETEK
ncbi:MAG: MarR family transcriptional regulator [Alphaproteobacteria bacterium]|nr:MarR family transcriptional regulator [Alphaproteobacteria bacterium]